MSVRRGFCPGAVFPVFFRLPPAQRYCSPRKTELIRAIVQTAFAFVLAAGPTPAQPPAARDHSPWNLLVAGGKGNFVTGPVCGCLESLTGSPLHFDYEQDFFQDKPADVRFTTRTATLGTVGDRRVLQLIQHVHDAHWHSDMVIKRLLVQRGGDTLCAVYQQIFDVAQVNVQPAALINLDNQPVLKTMDQNGQATWNEEYWAFDKDGPVHLDLSTLENELSKAVPPNSKLGYGAFDLRQSCLRRYVWRSDGSCRACDSPDGSVLARLVLRGGQLRVGWAQCFPSRTGDVCPP